MEGACAIGRIAESGAWLGFVRQPGGYRFAVGDSTGVRTDVADAALLLAIAIVFFEDALDDPPPDIEATQADVSGLVRHVAALATEPELRRLLEDAVDAIDDGLATDAVLNPLATAMGRVSSGQAEPVDLLRERAARLLSAPEF